MNKKIINLIYILIIILSLCSIWFTYLTLRSNTNISCGTYPNSLVTYHGLIKEINNVENSDNILITVAALNDNQKRFCNLDETIVLSYSGRNLGLLTLYTKNGGIKPGLGEIGNHLVVGAGITFKITTDNYDSTNSYYLIDAIDLYKPAEQFKVKE